MVVPTGAKSPARLFLARLPEEVQGEAASLPKPPARLCRRCPPCATAPWLVPLGLACASVGIALRGVLETLGLCFKFQGHEPFPGKNGQIKQKANNTNEGEGFDRGFAVNFNQAAGSRSRSPSLRGSLRVGCRWETKAGIL